MTEPDRCPFCGGQPTAKEIAPPLPNAVVRCGNSDCAVQPDVFADSLEQAVERWNRRAP